MTQAQMILQALKRGKRITPAYAFFQFGCLSLSQRIGDLKRKYKMPIVRDMIEVRPGTRVARYRLKRGG